MLAAWSITTDGKPAFIGLAPGSGESADAWADFLADLKDRGLPSPLLVISAGAPGLISAIEQAFPKALWSTPGLVETRFSPDALVWVAVVFHGTAAWRNHGPIIFRFVSSNICPAAPPWWRALPARPPAGGLGHLLVGHPLCAAGSPGGAR